MQDYNTEISILEQWAAAYRAVDWKLTPIRYGTKIPCRKAYQLKGNAVTDPREFTNHNIGLLCGHSQIAVIDIDQLDKARALLQEYGADLDAYLSAPNVVQIIGGQPNHAKLLYRVPPWFDLTKHQANDENKKAVIDFRYLFATGGSPQDIIPPSEHPNGRVLQWQGDWRNPPLLPEPLERVWRRLLGSRPPGSSPPPTGADRVKVEDALRLIDPDCNRDEWVKTLMMLHSTGEDWALEVADKWSWGGYWFLGESQVMKYDPDQLYYIWDLFRADGGLTIRSLYDAARNRGWKEDVAAKFGPVENGEVGTPPEALKNHTAMDLLEHYVFITRGRKVADLRLPCHAATVRLEEFRDAQAKLPSVDKVSAFKYWQQHHDRKTVAGEGYKPGAPKIFRQDRQEWFNTYHVPEHDPTEAEDQLGLFFEHIAFLFPQIDRRELFLDWMASIIQQPAERLQFTPLLVARQHGMGRGWLVRLLHKLVGEWNVSAPKLHDVVGGQWHDYLYRKLVVAIAETKERGQQAYKVDDQIREILTDTRIQMNLKGKDNLTADVYAKFLMISNHTDALKLPPEDRRIWVHETPGQPQSTVYYDRLYRWLKGVGPQQLFWWLKRRQLREGLFGMRAPMTPEKAQMTRYAMSVAERAFHDIVDEGALKVATFGQISQVVAGRCGQMPDQGHLRKVVQDSCEVYTGGEPEAHKIWTGGSMRRAWILDKQNVQQYQRLSPDEIRLYLS